MYFAVNLFPDLFVVPAIFQLLLGVASFVGGIRFLAYVKNRLATEGTEFEGLVTVFIPCKGIEPGLRQNLSAILNQSRAENEFIFVVQNEEDPVVPLIRSVTANVENTKLVFSGNAKNTGQKVWNLIKAFESADFNSSAFVFVDSDARPAKTWLFDLLTPLNDQRIVCSSGYRWFIQKNGGLGTHLRSAWNASIVSALGENEDTNFCWGGSTAIRRSDFERLGIIERWAGTVSDDFVLSNAVKESGVGIHFEPKCLTVSAGDCSLGELFEFTTRQMKITRIYSRKHFVTSFVGAILFSVIFFPGLLVLFFIDGFVLYLLAGILTLIWCLGSAKAILRVYAAQLCLPEQKRRLRIQYVTHAIFWPVTSALFLINDLAALNSRTISWRGITYELVSDKETRILNHE